MWLELNSCVKGDNTLFHWLVSHNHTSLSVDPPLPNPPIITNTVPVMCDAAWAYLPSGHWTDLTNWFLDLAPVLGRQRYHGLQKQEVV